MEVSEESSGRLQKGAFGAVLPYAEAVELYFHLSSSLLASLLFITVPKYVLFSDDGEQSQFPQLPDCIQVHSVVRL